MNVGFIGVGNIGAPIAGQLLKAGHALVVYDLRREAANTLLAAGAEWSDSPAALAAECEVGAPVSASIEGDAAIPLISECGHLVVPHLRGQPKTVQK